MHYLFSAHGQRALSRLDLTRTLLALDFDGTIAELEADPHRSRTRVENVSLLKVLARRMPIAIITGRGVADVRKKLGFKPRFIIGNHGLEGLGAKHAAKAVRVSRAWRKSLAAQWPDDPGLFIEDKRYSLSLHYREARDPRSAARWLRARIARLEPAPRVIGGKFIFNLTVADTAHKGTALVTLARRLRVRHAVFVGDDVTDEFAFREKRPGFVHVRVGCREGSAAAYYVRNLDGVTQLLRDLASTLTNARGPNV